MSLIPLCKQQSEHQLHHCVDFQPSLTNNGMCFTKNGASSSDIYKDTEYIRTFREVFLKGRNNLGISKNEGSGEGFKYTFMIDAQKVMDLKNGLNWNQTKQATFRIALHQGFDIPDIRDSSLKVRAGFKTTLRVSAFELQSDGPVKEIQLSKRNCKFEDESNKQSPFRRYSR